MIKYFVIFLLSILFCLVARGEAERKQKLKILIVINEGFRPEEYFEPRKIFDREGFDVKVAANHEGTVLPSRKHISEVHPVIADLAFENVKTADYDATVFVGGNGAWNEFLPNPKVHKILLDSIHLGKVTALICAATGLLATTNNLDGEHPQFKGRHITGFFEVEGILKKVGLLNFDEGTPGKAYVVTDGKLITGRDPISAKLFGESIVSSLRDQH